MALRPSRRAAGWTSRAGKGPRGAGWDVAADARQGPRGTRRPAVPRASAAARSRIAYVDRPIHRTPRKSRLRGVAFEDPRAAAQTAATSDRSQWRRYARSGALLAVTGVSLYLLLPSLVGVFSS